MTDADSLATPDRQDRIDYIYYQGKSLQAVSSQCYDNLGTVRKCCAFPNKLIANVLEILYL